jgi:hypothetical protein
VPDVLQQSEANPAQLAETLSDEHEETAHEAAMRGDRGAYLESLRCYMRAGRHEALRIRRAAA